MKKIKLLMVLWGAMFVSTNSFAATSENAYSADAFEVSGALLSLVSTTEMKFPSVLNRGFDVTWGWSWSNWRSNIRSFFSRMRERLSGNSGGNNNGGGNNGGGNNGGGSQSVPELDGSSGIIALGLMAGLIGLLRERRRKLIKNS